MCVFAYTQHSYKWFLSVITDTQHVGNKPYAI